ncbi:flagellar basal body P-ring formation chaperone FlgA [Aliiruegeria sabulilitoris]|uniref:flagellar basal body P-ring formation chaperone FlgA n=1 Tax=Aliiruegeria sabulilitoris TaxID=1510458 RepID=UPI0008324AF2|nr:flagellar basal body P-ring formation chaperone FlgA [Aliiruegeria sabulilitoris]NDR58530.1 flagellar basal body P-ring formation protein FlgA [Pseudoruegeria sp. M32A2M]
MNTIPLVLPLVVALAGQAAADSLVAAHTIRSRTIISAGDVQLVTDALPGALSDAEAAVGMEARVVLYAGRAIRPEDLSPPALIERNQIVPLIFNHNGLAITTDGRSLSRAALGDRVRAMNMQSRTTVSGTVDSHGRVLVGPTEMTFSRTE